MDSIHYCRRCSLPEGYPNIQLDKENICTHCQNYKPKKTAGREALERKLNQQSGKKYDILVPVSGGRDSTFVLYHAVKTFGKRVLAVHYDNEFEVPQARKNLLQAIERLECDFKIVSSHYHFPTKMVRHVSKAALPLGLIEIATNACVACTYGIRAATYREAVAQGIPFILWGDSDEEAMSFNYRTSRLKYFLSLRFYHYILFLIYTLLFQLELRIPNGKLFYLTKPGYSGNDLLELHFFDYLAWDRREIKDLIMKELGWEAPKDSATSWRFDCTIHEVINYCYKQHYGFSKDFDGFANMVRTGTMEKKEMLEQECNIGLMSAKLIHILKNNFKLSDKDISRYFDGSFNIT